MPKTYGKQTSFTAGELSPRYYSQVDADLYKRGLKTALNCQLLPQGPLKKRPGLKYIDEVSDSSETCRLIPYQIDGNTGIVCLFGPGYIWFYRDAARIGTVEVTTTYLEEELSTLTYVQLVDALYLFHEKHAPARLVRTDDNNWTLTAVNYVPKLTAELGEPGSGTLQATVNNWTDGIGTTVTFIHITGLYTLLTSDIKRDIVETNGPGRATIVSTSTATISTPFSTTAPTNDGWYMDISPQVSVTPSAVSGNITLTAAAAAWRSQDVGRYVYLNSGCGLIVSFTSSTVVRVNIIEPLASASATTVWTLEDVLWTTNKYPKIGAAFQQRLVAGNYGEFPNSIAATASGTPDNYFIGANDGDAISVLIHSNNRQDIKWMIGHRDLLVGTSSGEFSINGRTGAWTPADSTILPRTSYGSNIQIPVLLDNEVLFIQASGRDIRSLRYNFEIDGYVSEPLLQQAEHFGSEVITQIVYALVPDRLLYAVTSTGSLLSGLFIREQQINGYTKYTTDGLFENVCAVRNNTVDDVYVLVNRTINGSTKRYIELFSDDAYADSFIEYDGATTSTITGLDHLEGEEVQIQGNGAAQTSKTVSGGSITLDTDVETAFVGLPYTMQVETLPFNIPVNNYGSLAGQKIQWVEPFLRVYQSQLPTVNGQSRPTRTPTMEMDQAVDLYSGDVYYSNINSDSLNIVDTSSFPIFISGIFGQINV